MGAVKFSPDMETLVGLTEVSTIIDRLVARLRLVRVLEGFVRTVLTCSVLLCLTLTLDKFFLISLVAWQAILVLSAGLLIAALLMIVLVSLPTIKSKREEAFQDED